jgi:hypothetical protein
LELIESGETQEDMTATTAATSNSNAKEMTENRLIGLLIYG